MGSLKKLILIVVISCTGWHSHAQEMPPLLEIWEMSDDLDSLFKQIMEAHPDPYFFASPVQVQKAYYTACDALKQPMTRFEFAGIANHMTKVLEDSHTGYDYTQLAKLAFDQHHRILPLNIYSDNNQRLLIKNAWDSTLTAGWQIKCVNNIEAAEPYQIGLQQFSYTEADAWQSKVRVSDAIWPLMAANAWQLDSINSIEIEHPLTGEIKTLQSTAYTSKQYYKIRKLRAKKGAYESFNFEIKGEDDYAYMRVGTFAPASKDQYHRKIKQAFKEIKNAGVHHLILDIAGNGGGSSSNVEYLYSFIDSMGYNTPANVIGINSRLARSRSRVASKPFTRWIMRTFLSKNEDVRGFLKIADLPLGARDTSYFADPEIQKKYVFHGDVYLLINGMTASAGVDFTNAFQRRERGVVIGESCMGPNTGTFGNPARYRLPNSQLNFYIATIRYNYDNTFKPERAPLQPDVEVTITSQDLENEVNPLLEAALQLIEQK